MLCRSDVTPSLMEQALRGNSAARAQQQSLSFGAAKDPPGFAADGGRRDKQAIRRIAQNLILNAVKYTRQQGGITVTWGDSDRNDAKRWELCVIDTGPGFNTSSGQPLANALERPDAASTPPDSVKQADAAGTMTSAVAKAGVVRRDTSREEAGEGIGLSIVKRLCEMLDATIELKSEPNVGTSVRILFPRHYNSFSSRRPLPRCGRIEPLEKFHRIACRVLHLECANRHSGMIVESLDNMRTLPSRLSFRYHAAASSVTRLTMTTDRFVEPDSCGGSAPSRCRSGGVPTPYGREPPIRCRGKEPREAQRLAIELSRRGEILIVQECDLTGEPAFNAPWPGVSPERAPA